MTGVKGQAELLEKRPKGGVVGAAEVEAEKGKEPKAAAWAEECLGT